MPNVHACSCIFFVRHSYDILKSLPGLFKLPAHNLISSRNQSNIGYTLQQIAVGPGVCRFSLNRKRAAQQACDLLFEVSILPAFSINPVLHPNSSDGFKFKAKAKGHNLDRIGRSHGNQLKPIGNYGGPPLKDNWALWGASGRHLGDKRETTSGKHLEGNCETTGRRFGDHIWETTGKPHLGDTPTRQHVEKP